MVLEVVRLVGRMNYFNHEKAASVEPRIMAGSPPTRGISKSIVEEARTKIEQETLQFCDLNRQFDWLTAFCEIYSG